MITNAILALVNLVVGAFDHLIPSFTLPAFFSSGGIIPSGVVDFLAAALSAISPFFPSALLLSVLCAAAALWPAVLGYLVFQWVLKHTPVIAGFGLGGG